MGSKLPKGEYILTDGSNYGLDGFRFDTEYNGGVLEGARLPEAYGLAGLPDGIVGASYTSEEEEEEEEVGPDLTSFLGDKMATPLADHYWLETAAQDPERLPQNPSDLGIPELEEAWGVERRTDGIRIIPNIENYDRIPSFGASEVPGHKYDPSSSAQGSELPGDAFRQVVKKAMQLSAFGKPLGVIKDYLGRSLSGSSYEKVAALIEREHGLAGNVFIHASALPGLHNGKWEKQVRRLSARYIVASPDSKVGGSDRLHGKKIVSSVPWREAFEHYAPRLEGSGVRVASGGSYRERLRHAFLGGVDVTDKSPIRLSYDLNSRVVEKSYEDFEAPEVVKVVRWAKAQMSEGFAGQDLSDLMGMKFSEELLKRASKSLKIARQTHEGVAGQIYVDASAYASKAGIAGCEEGALRHRTNPIKNVLKMARCSTCVFNSQGCCQKYNKRLASLDELGDVKGYQKEALRLADASDAEITASLFNPAEYSLGNDSLNDFDFDEGPTNEKLAEVSFGGIFIGD